MKKRLVLPMMLSGLLCFTACGGEDKIAEYHTADLPLQSFDLQYREDGTLPFVLQTVSLPVEEGVPRAHLVDGSNVFFVLDHEEYALSSNDIELVHYDTETGEMTSLFHHTDETNTMRFAEMMMTDGFVYLLAYTEEPYDENRQQNFVCAVWQIHPETLTLRTIDSIEVGKAYSLRRALFPTKEGLCFAYSMYNEDEHVTRITEKVYDVQSDSWTTAKLMKQEGGDDYVANQDADFVCDESGDTAVFSYAGAYRLVTDTADALYVDGTADYVNWAEKITEGENKYYYYYHFDAESRQLYRTKTEKLGYQISSAGDYVMLWRDAEEPGIFGQTMFCLLPENGTLISVGTAGYTASAIADDTDTFSFILRDKRDNGTGDPMIAYIPRWRD